MLAKNDGGSENCRASVNTACPAGKYHCRVSDNITADGVGARGSHVQGEPSRPARQGETEGLSAAETVGTSIARPAAKPRLRCLRSGLLIISPSVFVIRASVFA